MLLTNLFADLKPVRIRQHHIEDRQVQVRMLDTGKRVRSGVKSAVILDGRVPHSLLVELLSDAGIGTMLTN